jgi:hypothetical protein
MADESRPQVVLTQDQYDRQQLAREMAALKDNPLDKTVPGGRYMGADGTLKDSEGKPVGEDAGEAPAAGTFDVDGSTKEQLQAEAERRGLTVTRADGKDGDPLVEDYRAALKQ